jgi:hypothetical protein
LVEYRHQLAQQDIAVVHGDLTRSAAGA